jgi:hypothetical protein
MHGCCGGGRLSTVRRSSFVQISQNVKVTLPCTEEIESGTLPFRLVASTPEVWRNTL